MPRLFITVKNRVCYFLVKNLRYLVLTNQEKKKVIKAVNFIISNRRTFVLFYHLSKATLVPRAFVTLVQRCFEQLVMTPVITHACAFLGHHCAQSNVDSANRNYI